MFTDAREKELGAWVVALGISGNSTTWHQVALHTDVVRSSNLGATPVKVISILVGDVISAVGPYGKQVAWDDSQSESVSG